MTVKLLVVDLDGTLASTANLSNERRCPADILKYSPVGTRKFPFTINDNLKQEFSELIQSGIPVVVITRAPMAYASTLLFLLGLDFTECFPSSPQFSSPGLFNGIDIKLKHVAQEYGVEIGEVLYIGDLDLDEAAASSAHCLFEKPPWLRPINSAQSASHYEALLGLVEGVGVDNKSEYSRELAKSLETNLNILKWIYEEVSTKEEFVFEFTKKNLQFKSTRGEFSKGIKLFNSPFYTDTSFKPILNPVLISRFDYDNDTDLLDLVRTILKNLFPKFTLRPHASNQKINSLHGREIGAITEYAGRLLGDVLWSKCKNWKNLQSGPEVNLHLLEFVALVMAAWLEDETTIIPTPATKYSDTHPGEVSRRLAHRISEIMNLNILDAFEKSSDGTIQLRDVNFIPNREYCVVDDQLTDGGTMEQCMRLIPSEFKKSNFWVWSFSASGERWESSIPRELVSKSVLVQQ